MTFEKDKVIKIPIWLVSVLLPILISVIVSLSVFNFERGTINEKVIKNQTEIQEVQKNKVDRNEMNLIILSLQRIEGKLDSHIAAPEKK